jgi:hypothetical protein
MESGSLDRPSGKSPLHALDFLAAHGLAEDEFHSHSWFVSGLGLPIVRHSTVLSNSREVSGGYEEPRLVVDDDGRDGVQDLRCSHLRLAGDSRSPLRLLSRG